MSVPVDVQRIFDSDKIPHQLLETVQRITDEIHERAYHLFKNRGGHDGKDLDDWYQAERDILGDPSSELQETETGYQARISLPGFETKDVKVTAMPRELVVEAEKTHSHEGVEGSVQHSELSTSTVFRKYGFADDIDVDCVTAKLNNGVLEIEAKKAGAPANSLGRAA